MANAVDVEHLWVLRRGQSVLRDVSCAVQAGTVTGLLVPSGSGKTTLMRALIGVQRVAAGRITVLGRSAGSFGLRAEVGYVTQAPSVYDDLTVRENLDYFAAVLGTPAASVAQAVAAVSLVESTGTRVGRLSGGQRARVSLAAALLGAPRLLVLDEPTVGLDPEMRQQLWALFHRLAATGVTLLVSSHIMDEADRCTRLLLLRDGELLADATPDDLRARTGAAALDEVFLRLVRTKEAT